ncbi:tetratricopeptide repeat protein [Dactylosporangium sp. NPDC000244]|uniref:tetratricopeptide repeat protein n=1 Tax=Dactylosporangium sp. NPDC000244 TaxID=3154365 RepID=UPI00331A2979
MVDPSGVSTLDELSGLLRDLRRRQARRVRSSPLTFGEMAARTGWPHAVIGTYFDGRALPPAERLEALLRLLGASPAECFAFASARSRIETVRPGFPAAGGSSTLGGSAPGTGSRALPPAPPGFAGRAGVVARLDRLLPGARAVVIGGAAGVGKTALAIHYGHRIADRFPAGAVFLDLRGSDPSGPPLPPAEALRILLDALGVAPADLPLGVAARTGLFRSLTARRGVLFVLDDAADAAQVRPLLPAAGDSVAIITGRSGLFGLAATPTRPGRPAAGEDDVDATPARPGSSFASAVQAWPGRPAAGEDDADATPARPGSSFASATPVRPGSPIASAVQAWPGRPAAGEDDVVGSAGVGLAKLSKMDGVATVVLDAIDRTEARAVLAARIGADRVAAEPDAVDLIITSCGRLPMALSVVSARVALHPELRLTAVADALAEATAFSWAYDRLTPDARRLFRGFGAHPGPDLAPADAAVLIATAPASAASTSPAPAASTSPAPISAASASPASASSASASGASASSASASPASASGAAASSAPVSAVSTSSASTSSTSSASVLSGRLAADALAELARAQLITEARPGRYAMHALLREHAAARTSDAERGAMQDRLVEHGAEFAVLSLAMRRGRYRDAWRIADAVDADLDAAGRWDDRIAAQEIAIRAAERLGDLALLARAQRAQSAAYLHTGQHESALRRLREAADCFLAQGEPAAAARCRQDLAALLESMARFAEAIVHDELALALFRRAADRHGQAAAHAAAAWHYAQAGRATEAVAHGEAALSLRADLDDPHEVAAALAHLGRVHAALGERDRSLEHLRAALDRYTELGDRLDEADTATRLGDALDGAPAIGLWRRAHAIYERLGHPSAETVAARLGI